MECPNCEHKLEVDLEKRTRRAMWQEKERTGEDTVSWWNVTAKCIWRGCKYKMEAELDSETIYVEGEDK